MAVAKTKKAIKKIETLSDLRPDANNINRGTERGNFQLDWSVGKFGAWRSIAASADGVVAAGNQTLEQAAAHGLKIRPVHTTGDELVVVIRDDIHSSDPEFRGYAIADNRTSETNYNPDIERLLEAQAGGIDIDALYRTDETEQMLKDLARQQRKSLEFLGASNTEIEPSEPKPQEKFPLAIVLTAKQNQEWKKCKEQLGDLSDTQAFLKIWQQR